MAGIKIKRSYFAFPYFFLSLVFVVVPIVILLVSAFIDGETGSFTFANFANFFSQKDTWAVVGRSFFIAFCTTVICLLIAYPLAMILADSKINKSALLVMLFVLPMWINSILRTYAVKGLFDILGMSEVNSYVRIVIAMVYDFFPFMLLPLYTVMVNMDKSYIEASKDLGAGPVQNFLKIKLPLSFPGIMSGILMVFMPTVSTFAIPNIISNNIYLLGNLINDYFVSGKLYNIGSAYAFILLMIIALTMFVANRLTGGKIQQSGKGGGASV